MPKNQLLSLITLAVVSTQAQFHGVSVYDNAFDTVRNANFDELGSNLFSYGKSLPTIENIIKTLAVDNSFMANVSADCSEDFDLMVSETTNLLQGGNATGFAQTLLQLIDSSGKPGAGILLGNTRWFGLFKECQAIEYDLGNRTFAGKYNHVIFAPSGANKTTCTSASPISPNTFTIDVCLPKTCSAIDIETIVNGALKKKIVCEVQSLPRKAHANAGTWITLVIIAVVLFLGVTASVFDYFVLPYHKQEPYVNSLWMQCWRSFSLYTNVVEIFNTKGANKPGNIGPLNCMRFFSICWVVMGHSIIFFILYSVNPASFMKLQQYRIFSIINNSYFSVDTFFWQSGLLLTFVWLKKYKQNKQQVMSAQAWILFYVHRIVRLSPPYFLVIAFYTFVYMPFATKNMSVDPEWTPNYCTKNWWVDFIYLNNAIHYRESCYPVSWYLSADMQMFLFTPVILIPLTIKKSYGVIVALVILALSTGANIFQMYHYYFPPIQGSFGGGNDPRMTVDATTYNALMYNAPWIRCQVYIVGMLTGVLLHSYKKLKIPIIVQVLGWIMTFSIACGCLLSLKSFFLGHVIPLGWRTLFSAASKPLWGVALSWIVVTCYYGYGSFINSFMSWTIWVPLGRLSYSTYLVHVIVCNYVIGQNQQLFVYANFFQLFTMYLLPLISCSFAFALFWSSAFELGFGKLESVLVNAMIRSKPQPMPVRPRASTLDPPVPETLPETHGNSANSMQRRQFISAIELPIVTHSKKNRSTKTDIEEHWS
uniref:NRF domain-containing protein n=1 Tax=Panagrellus redivivus TaxID=6233 RepID=A0A7E4ZTZ0_PANRE